MRRLPIQFIALLVLVSPALSAGNGLDSALQRLDWLDPFGGSIAVADFDRDQNRDGAVLVHSNPLRQGFPHRVAIHFSNRPDIELAFEAYGAAVKLSARDVDQDDDSDLVVEQRSASKGFRVWINDGAGGFQEARVEDYPGLQSPQELGLAACLVPVDVSVASRHSGRPGLLSIPEVVVFAVPSRSTSISHLTEGRPRRLLDRSAGPSRAPPSVSAA